MESGKEIEKKIVYRGVGERDEGCAKCIITKKNKIYTKRTIYQICNEGKRRSPKCKICKKENILLMIEEKRRIDISKALCSIEPGITGISEITLLERFKVKENNEITTEGITEEKDKTEDVEGEDTKVVETIEQRDWEIQGVQEKEEAEYNIEQEIQKLKEADKERELEQNIEPIMNTSFTDEEIWKEILEAMREVDSKTSPNETSKTMEDNNPQGRTDEEDNPQTPKDYSREKVRRESFKNWPSLGIDTEKLAKAGFYFTGKEDIVTCYACQLSLSCWREGDEPMVEHQKWNRSCAVINLLRNDNIPIEKEHRISGPNASTDECGLYTHQQIPSSKISQTKRCKICFMREIEVIFLPCGHLVCCRECGEILLDCGICKIRIEKQMKVHFT